MSTHDSLEHKSDRVSLADEEGVKRVLVSSILDLWDVVNNLTRLRPSRRDRYRVSIFGSARAQAGTFAYEETRRVAAALAEMGCNWRSILSVADAERGIGGEIGCAQEGIEAAVQRLKAEMEKLMSRRV